MTIQVRLIRLGLKVILNVDFVASGSMETTSSLYIAVTVTNVVIYATAATKEQDGNLSTTWTTIAWNSTFGKITSSAPIESAWKRSLWCLTRKWI